MGKGKLSLHPALVVFDMAGTTVYDGDAVHTCLGDALADSDVVATRDEINEVMGLPKPLAIRMILESRSLSPASDELVTHIHEDFLGRMLTHYFTSPAVREIDGASEVFRSLQADGIKVALDTGFSRQIVDAILDRLGWANSDVLDATVASDEVVNGRPHPDLIFRAMELTGITDASQVAKVGDTPSDLLEGTAAGCGWVIGVTEGSHTGAQLAACPHTHLITTVADLPALFGHSFEQTVG